MASQVSMRPATLLEKDPESDLLRDTIQSVCQRMMDHEVRGRCSAVLGERKPGERSTQRSGYREGGRVP